MCTVAGLVAMRCNGPAGGWVQPGHHTGTGGDINGGGRLLDGGCPRRSAFHHGPEGGAEVVGQGQASQTVDGFPAGPRGGGVADQHEFGVGSPGVQTQCRQRLTG